MKDSTTLSAAVAAALQPYAERGELAGAVTLVADADGVCSLDTVGTADFAGGRAMTPDTLFWIASQTKPITAAAVMMLVDEGKLDVDAPVAQYLPEFAGQMVVVEQDDEHCLLRKPRHPITVANVLSHTSGLAFASLTEHPTLHGLPLPQAVRSYAMMPLVFEPDTQYLYSNCGINTAARILEVLTEQPYEEFLQERLLDPLGMVDTTFWPTAEQVQRLATAYRPGPDGTGFDVYQIVQLTYPLEQRVGRYPMPAGGLFSTAADCARFCRMVLRRGELDGRRYLSEAAVAEMTRRWTAPEIENSYGLGWQVGDGWAGHGGALASHMRVLWSLGAVQVYLVQHAGFAGDGAQAGEAFSQAVRGALA